MSRQNRPDWWERHPDAPLAYTAGAIFALAVACCFLLWGLS